MTDVMTYIEAHRDEVEREYRVVLERVEENRQYWDARNRQRLERIAHTPPKPGQEELHAKLQVVKARIGME